MSEKTEEKTEDKAENKDKKTEKPKTRREHDMDFLPLHKHELVDKVPFFKDILMDCVRRIKNHNFLDVEDAEKEVDFLAENTDIYYHLEDDLDFGIYISAMDDVQKARDTMTTIYSRAYSDHSIMNGFYNHLFKIWTGKFSNLSSDKRREGEAEYILHLLYAEVIRRENFLNKVKNYYYNLGNKMEAISRKITTIQMMHKLVGGILISPEEFEEKKKSLKEANKKILEKSKKSPIKTGKVGWEDIPE